MIDPVELAAMPPEQQRDAVLRDVALACERALAVIGPGDVMHPGLSRAADGLAHRHRRTWVQVLDRLRSWV